MVSAFFPAARALCRKSQRPFGPPAGARLRDRRRGYPRKIGGAAFSRFPSRRSEEHTSELQSLRHLVCRLLLDKKNEREEKMGNQTTNGAQEMSTHPLRCP